jgi:hypothetical protein
LNSNTTVLIFPIDMPQSVAFARTARQLGHTLVVASSEPVDSTVYPHDTIAHLPYVTEREFDDAFTTLLRKHRITQVFAPHPAIWGHLRTLLQNSTRPVDFTLCNDSPYEMDWHAYGVAYQWAQACLTASPLLSQKVSSPLPLANYAGLHRLFNQVPGQSDDTKLHALTQIMRSTPSGDVVEIGSLYGKSAFALAWLAKFHHIGTLICVDPWEVASISNQGSQARLINRTAILRNWQQAFLGFAASLAGFENVNYLRAPSSIAATIYAQRATAGCVISEEFGATPVSGAISLLHIDGNHKYEIVKSDLEAWLPMVKQGGWILLDDYLWAFGDGPQRVGDEFLERHAVQTAFVMGDTLFIQV